MRQPFSLDQALREQTSVGVAQKQARQRMFDKQAADATMILNQKIKELQKKAQKGAGLFKGLGKNASWVKAALSTTLGALGPYGKAADLAIKAADAAKTQKDLKKQEKAIKSMGGIPAKFAGTFLDDYLRGGITDAKGQMGDFIKGRKDTAKMMAAVSMVPTVLEGMESLGTAAEGAEAAGKTAEVAGDAGETIIDQGGLSSIASKTADELAAESAEVSAKAGAQAAEKTFMQKAKDKAMEYLARNKEDFSYYGPEGVPDQTGSDYFLNRQFANLEKGLVDYGQKAMDAAGNLVETGADAAEKLVEGAPTAFDKFKNKLSTFATGQLDKGVPGTFGLLNVRDLTSPLGMGGQSLASDLYQNYLNKPTGEQTMTRARAPRYY